MAVADETPVDEETAADENDLQPHQSARAHNLLHVTRIPPFDQSERFSPGSRFGSKLKLCLAVFPLPPSARSGSLSLSLPLPPTTRGALRWEIGVCRTRRATREEGASPRRCVPEVATRNRSDFSLPSSSSFSSRPRVAC